MAQLAGGYGSWQDHAAMDARCKNQALAERVTRLEAQVAELQAALKARDEADATVVDLYRRAG
jgi:BMFP domain-containing protein YqiC